MSESICSYTKERLAKLFDEQIAVLQRVRNQQQTLVALTDQREGVITKASEMVFLESHTPFIPVIPSGWRSILDQVVFLHEQLCGFCRIDPQKIWNKDETPKTPYFIFNVEDGHFLRKEDPRTHEQNLEINGRRFLTVEEIINLALQKDVLLRHWLIAPASGCKVTLENYGEVEGIPSLMHFQDQVLMLCIHHANLKKVAKHMKQAWGLPTCFKESYSGEIAPVSD